MARPFLLPLGVIFFALLPLVNNETDGTAPLVSGKKAPRGIPHKPNVPQSESNCSVFLYARCTNTGQCCTKGAFCGLSSRNTRTEPICRCPKDHAPSENDYQCVPLFPCNPHCPENKVCNQTINLCVCVNGFTLKENGQCYLSGRKYIQPGPVNADDVDKAEIEKKGVTPKTETSPSTVEVTSTEKPDKSRSPDMVSSSAKHSSPPTSHSSGVEPFSASPALSIDASKYHPNVSQVLGALEKNRQPNLAKNGTHVVTAKEQRENAWSIPEIVFIACFIIVVIIVLGTLAYGLYKNHLRKEDIEESRESPEAVEMVPLRRSPVDANEIEIDL